METPIPHLPHCLVHHLPSPLVNAAGIMMSESGIETEIESKDGRERGDETERERDGERESRGIGERGHDMSLMILVNTDRRPI